jgi:hypothetical protein
MLTIFRESEWYGQPVVKEFLTRDDLAAAELAYVWERQMDPYDMVWQEEDSEGVL